MGGDPPVALTLRTCLAGPVARDARAPRIGAARGRAADSWCRADLTVVIDDLAACMRAPDHPARIQGTVSVDGLATRAPLDDGRLELWVPDPEVGMKRSRCRLDFRGADDVPYRLEATSFVRPGRTSWRERRTAYARIRRCDAEEAVVAAGMLGMRWRDVLGMLWSLDAEGLAPRLARRRVVAFVRRELCTPVPVQAT